VDLVDRDQAGACVCADPADGLDDVKVALNRPLGIDEERPVRAESGSRAGTVQSCGGYPGNRPARTLGS
jgi:hypothetical protein